MNNPEFKEKFSKGARYQAIKIKNTAFKCYFQFIHNKVSEEDRKNNPKK